MDQVVTLQFTLPSAKVADALDALREYHGVPNATPAQIKDVLEEMVKAHVRTVYKAYMKKNATFDITL